MSTLTISEMTDAGSVTEDDLIEISRPVANGYATYKAKIGYIKNLTTNYDSVIAALGHEPVSVDLSNFNAATFQQKVAISYGQITKGLGYEPMNVDFSNFNGSTFQQKVTLSYGQITGGLGYEPANKDLSNIDGMGLVSKINAVRGAAPVLTTGGELTGNLNPASDGVITLGQPNRKWAEIYASNGAINTSDARQKMDIASVPDEVLDVWGNLSWRQFKFRKAVETKGFDKARWHFGLIAQEVEDAYKNAGLDAESLGMICHDHWEAHTRREKTGNMGKNGKPVYRDVLVPAGEAYGLRYSECQAIEAAWQRREIIRQQAEIDALKAQITQAQA
ncbi:MAG: tail fiber domain-containing protein [Zymomonas mobilis]|uniref:tail fiber domain-containing protein n=1 Tax=Zymomonas mobilis TaxID=542 RepID=UPI0039EA2798